MKTPLLCLVLAALTASAAWANGPNIEAVMTDKVGMNWRIAVTLRHPDTGWDHYADSWRIEDVHGRVIATRELLHPHVQEQPFTRSLSSVMVPDGVRELFVRARCSVEGWDSVHYRIEMSPEM
ncbi:hypothetical protein [Puniceibacterium confluentis]|uniref:hypothetical protein n=1 Tax=Puniceibacterium confluentis TaxID=1958944 RepID=UPI0011B70EEF|nr:hypothetical protein [Puniceibacterium confluentis]